MHVLESIYREAIDACAPQILVRGVVEPDMPRAVVAIGKCAGALFDGIASTHAVEASFVVLPEGYRAPAGLGRGDSTVLFGGHPHLTAETFDAGRRLLEFVDRHDAILFAVSGGGSACVDVPLAPWFTESDLAAVNAALLARGLPIGTINVVRKHLSAIKGGRLASRVRRSVTLLYSDVATGALGDVASGPTLADLSTNEDAARALEGTSGCDVIVTKLRDPQLPETVKEIDRSRAVLVADNTTLTTAAGELARRRGFEVSMIDSQVETDVAEAASLLLDRARLISPGEMLIAGGEPTVTVHGGGRGGRCSDLAVRFAMLASEHGITGLTALFGSSDGVDGNSGAAGVLLESTAAKLDRAAIEQALTRSDSLTIAEQLGRAVIMAPTGNNLRDLFLVART